METRRILQLVLAGIITMIVVFGAFIAYTLTREPPTEYVSRIARPVKKVEQINPYANQGATAIKLVENLPVLAPPPGWTPPDEEEAKKRRRRDRSKDEVELERTTIGEVVSRPEIVKEILKLSGREPVGWRVDWWGETKYGPWFYLVRYGFRDANITVGPAWLVDLKKAEVVPKNVLARAVMDPLKAAKDERYDKHQQVVSALASHRFESGLPLGGALLMHFEQREEGSEEDAILGWTIEHDRGDLYRAYFQWTEAGEPTYAEFEFDYAKKALKASNLQAADVMRIGEDFEKTERADIMPAAYDTSANNWNRKMQRQCRRRTLRSKCSSLAAIFREREIVESLEWLLTARSESPEVFSACKDERKCKWVAKPKPGAEEAYLVSYVYDLPDAKEREVSWEVALKGRGEKTIRPIDRLSQASWSAVHPRND